MLSPSAKSDLPLFTIRDYERTIEPRIHTSRFVDANENNSGSSRRDRPNGFCRSTLPSIMPSTSNAIFYPDVYSRRFEPRRSLSGIKVGLPTDPDHDRILETTAVNVSMPSPRAGHTHQRQSLLRCGRPSPALYWLRWIAPRIRRARPGPDFIKKSGRSVAIPSWRWPWSVRTTASARRDR